MEYRKEFHRINKHFGEYLDEEDLVDILAGLYPGQLVFNTLDGISGTYYYIYQLGNDIRLDISEYPNLPSKLFEDTPRYKIKEIYGINPYSEKI
jgi:hypothetical protein